MTALEIQYWQMILQAIMGLVTASIGIGGVYFGQYVLKRSEEKKALAEWWGNYSLTEGVEPFLAYVNNLEQRILRAYRILTGAGIGGASEQLIQKITVLPIPHTAIARVETLINRSGLSLIVDRAEQSVDYTSADGLYGEYMEVAQLRQLLMTLHIMFMVSDVTHKGQALLTARTEAVREAVRLFNLQTVSEPVLVDDRNRLNYLAMVNIFATDNKRKAALKKIMVPVKELHQKEVDEKPLP